MDSMPKNENRIDFKNWGTTLKQLTVNSWGAKLQFN